MVRKIRHRPPGDESSSHKPTRDKAREELQKIAIDAIFNETNFKLVCILASLCDTSPYDNYSFPQALDELEFTLKGLLRLEMIGYMEDGKDISNPKLRKYRRLFGTTKDYWKCKDAKNLPKAWRSRVYLKFFKSKAEAKSFIEGCPLRSWGNIYPCDLLKELEKKPDGRFVLLQVHDVNISENETFSDLLKEFITNHSKLLTLITSATL